jgi:hypothetical protein
MAKPIKLKHDATSLSGKNIEFRIRANSGDPPQRGIAEGDGILTVDGPDGDGMYEVSIKVSVLPDNPARVGIWRITVLPLSQRLADCLEIRPDGTLSCVDDSILED